MHAHLVLCWSCCILNKNPLSLKYRIGISKIAVASRTRAHSIVAIIFGIALCTKEFLSSSSLLLNGEISSLAPPSPAVVAAPACRRCRTETFRLLSLAPRVSCACFRAASSLCPSLLSELFHGRLQ